MAKQLNFTTDENGVARMDASKLEDMTIPQFVSFEGRLHNVRRDRVYDTIVFEANTTITPAHKKTLFRKGIDEMESYATSATEYKKTLIHTNMLKGGEFEKNDLVIIRNIEVQHPMFGGVPVTVSAGEIQNARVTFPGTYDPAVAAWAWLSQSLIQFKRGNSVIVENLAINFPQDAGLYAAYGANAGAYVQNGQGVNLLPGVQVLEGGDDFSVVFTPLATTFNNTTATPGLDQQIKTTIVLDLLRLRTIYS
jgi:hypothetical protein